MKNNTLIAAGRHEGPGTPHAEIMALDQAKERAQGATIYVTLEPCCHWGRTAPCTDRIIASGIKHVIAAVQDPNPDVEGAGFQKLRDAGISVRVGLLESEAKLLNRAYFTWRTCQRPYVYAKVAQSLDGKVATRTGHSQWITSEASRQDGHTLRSEVDAIIVGVGTVLADDPLLTARPVQQPQRQPLRVICDSQGRTPANARCLAAPGATLIATTPRMSAQARNRLAAQGGTVWLDSKATDRVDIRRLLARLAAEDVTSVLVEGGPTLIGTFRDENLIDELHLYVAPMVIGGTEALSSVGGLGAETLTSAMTFADQRWFPIDRDMKFVGRTWRDHLDTPGGN